MEALVRIATWHRAYVELCGTRLKRHSLETPERAVESGPVLTIGKENRVYIPRGWNCNIDFLKFLGFILCVLNQFISTIFWDQSATSPHT